MARILSAFPLLSILAFYVLVIAFTCYMIFRDVALVSNFNATSCYSDKVSTMKQDCADTANQVCIRDQAGAILNLNRIFITRQACNSLCGNGFGFWPSQDILLRVFLWVVPAIVLISHFHFPPLAVSNYGAILVHILGDPIDSLWSMLLRMETYRYLYHKAWDSKPKRYRSVATIWCAYDELGFQDPSDHFLAALQRIRESEGDPGFLYDPQLRGRASTLPIRQQEAPGIFKRVSAAIKEMFTRSPQGTELFQSPTEHRVMYLVERAAQHLVANRSEGALASWVAIYGLVSAIGGAYVRTWDNRLNNQTAHTIATVTLLFIIIPMVKLSGVIGSFISSTEAIDTIQNLRRELRKLGEGYDLFPDFTFKDRDDLWDPESASSGNTSTGKDAPVTPSPSEDATTRERLLGQSSPHTDNQASAHGASQEALRIIYKDTTKELAVWPQMAAFSGMNSSWRPVKWAVPGKRRSAISKRKSVVLLTISVFLVICCCYMPALIISYFTPLKGFACRSLAWTLVAISWTISIVIDRIFRALPQNATAGSLWKATIGKDLIITLYITFLVISQQIGLYNSCYCRSGALLHANPDYVNLSALTDAEWDSGWRLWLSAPITAIVVNLIFIGLAEFFYCDSRKLLNRGKSDREENIRYINKLAAVEDLEDGFGEAAARGETTAEAPVPANMRAGAPEVQGIELSSL